MEEARWVAGRGERGGGGVMRAVVPTRTRAHSSGHGQRGAPAGASLGTWCPFPTDPSLLTCHLHPIRDSDVNSLLGIKLGGRRTPGTNKEEALSNLLGHTPQAARAPPHPSPGAFPVL